MATLRELFTPEEMERFLELRRQGMSDELAVRFRDRYTRSAANLDFLIEHNLRKPSPYHNTQEVARLRGERADLFNYVLKDIDKYNVPFIKGTSRDLAHLVRSAHTDESGAYKGFLKKGTVARESLVDAITEKGPHGFLWDVAKSVVTTPIEGAGDIVAGRGWGEHPLEFTAKVGSAIPLLRGAASLTGGGLARSGLRAATRELPPDAQDLIKQLAKSNASPAQMAEALGGVGFNRARAGELLQKAVNHPAWRVPARSVEAADILGAREEFLSEIVGELMIEGAVAGGRALYDSADPVQSQQARRKADNDAAAEERFQRIHKPKIDAAVDAAAIQLAGLTYQAVSGPSGNTNIPDAVFVMGFENHIAPHVQGTIDMLTELGLENAGDVLRARMLQLHQQANQPEGETDATDTGTAAGSADTGTPDTDQTVPESEQGTAPESAEGTGETPTQKTPETPEKTEVAPEPTPEELEAQAQADAEALVASSNRPNQYPIENALEAADTPMDTETFIAQHGDLLPQAYRDNPRATDLFLSQLATDEGSRVTATEIDGVRQYTAEAAVDTIPDAQKGPVTTAYMTDATPYKVRPVVRPLDDLVPSHDIEGNETPDYPQDLQPRTGRTSLTSGEVTRENAGRMISDRVVKFPIQFDTGPPLTSKQHPARTVAGTGRTNMLKYVRDKAQDPAPENDIFREIWQDYQDTLRAEVEALNMDPAVLDQPDPVLTYELAENVDEVAIAEDTNIKSTFGATGAEQAKHDAEALFDEDTLSRWDGEVLAPFESNIGNPKNQAFRLALIKKIPTHLRREFLNENENLSPQGIKRLQDALMHYVFGGTRVAQLLVDEGGIEDAPKIKLMLEYIIVDLAVVKSRGLDIAPELDAAIHQLITFSKRADAVSEDERKMYKKDVRVWKEVSTYLLQPALDGTAQDAPLVRQLVYLLYTKRGAEKQLAEHFQQWTRAALNVLASEAGMFGALEDPKEVSSRLFDGVIKAYLTEEAFEVDEDREKKNEKNVWRTPGNLPPELQEIREHIDAIESPVQQTEAFNTWVEGFIENIHSIQGDTDAAAATGTDNQQDTGTGSAQRSPTGQDTGTPTGLDPEEQPGDDSSDSGQPDAEDDGDPGDAGDAASDDASEDVGTAVDDKLGPRFSEMDAETLLDYLQSENVVYVNRSRDDQWANFRVGQDYDDGAGIGTAVTVQLQTPTDGTVRARLIVIDRNNEVFTVEKDIASTSAKLPTARTFIEELTVNDLTGETTPDATPQDVGDTLTKAQVEGIVGRSIDDAAIRDINEILNREENPSYWHISSVTLTHDDAGSPVRMTQAQAEQVIALSQQQETQPDDTESDETVAPVVDTAVQPEAVPEDTPEDTSELEQALETAGRVSLDEWNAAEPKGKRSFLQKQERSIDVHLQTGAITEEQAEQKREAIAFLRQRLDTEAALATVFTSGEITLAAWNATPDAEKQTSLQRAGETLSVLEQAGSITPEQAADRRAAIETLQRSIEEDTDVDTETDRDADSETDTETEEGTQQPSSGAGTPTDTNQMVGVSRQTDESGTSEFPPEIQSALTQVGISVDEWEAALEVGNALEILNSLATDIDNVDAITTLHASLDDRADPTPAEMEAETQVDIDEDFDEETDEDIDDDFFGVSEVQPPNKLRDITDEQRSDFETVRRKLFLAKTIARLEAKTDRTLEETLQLAALTSTQRNDAQQEIYEDLLTRFIDRQVTRLQAKTERSMTEDRVLAALTAVQAKGIPDEASDMSLYSDLDTPDQEHSSPLAETRTLAAVRAPDTSETEVDLPADVTADTSKLSPAQLTSVKAIIAAFKRKIHTSTDTTVQGGFLLADKPGVGKTRQALAVIWHYMRQGIAKHFIIAPDQSILNNFNKDMTAMEGPGDTLSHYDSSNPKPETPVATATYATLVRKPNLKAFNTTSGNQNAVADIIEHLTGVRPTLRQTHPTVHKAMTEAFARIGIHNVGGTTDAEIVENAVEELRRQAKRVNLKSPANVDQFRQRITPHLADLLLNERQGGGTQLHIGGGSDLHSAVRQLLTFAQTHISAEVDPDFAEAAENFEGVIVLDEAHKAAGTSSQTGQMIDKITELLPNAKFLYMSATPFKKIDDFAVASRLGLWGANQAFPRFKSFADTFKNAARAVKEVIPLHLKQIGRYISRALSSKETKYTPIEIPLTDTETAQYDTVVTLVHSIRQQFDAAIDAALGETAWGKTLEDAGAAGRYRAKYMRDFYNATQKIYLAFLDSMKAQGLAPQIQEQLQNGDKIIVQLENTWDKTIAEARRRGKKGAIGPFDLLIDFIENENLFPVHVQDVEMRTDKNGKPYAAPVTHWTYDENGNRVRAVDATLKARQEQAIAALRAAMQNNSLVTGLPFAADIIHAAADAAGVASGEISGRSQVYSEGTPRPMPQNTESRDQRSKTFSGTTDLNLIVLGPAGLTGINLPVLENIKDKVNNFYHYLLQSSWNVNTFEQGLGRGKRANSAIDPHYIIAHQDLPGADRVLGATLAKFAEMGALAGQADSALMQNVDKVEGETSLDDDPEADAPTEDVFDEDIAGEKGFVFGQHGEEALEQMWYDTYNSGDFSIADTLGLPRPEMAGPTGFLDPKTIPSVKSFFQRLLHQPTAIQHQFYTVFEEHLKKIIAYNKELNTLDTGANDFNATDGQILDRLTIYTDPDTGKTAEMVKLSVKRRLPRRSWEFLQKVLNQEPGYEQHAGDRFAGFYADADGHIWAVFENPYADGETEYIRWGPRGTPIAGLHKGENRVTATQLVDDFTPIDDADAQQRWETEDADGETHVDSEMFMATGMMLPKWRDLGTGRYDHPVMAVIAMADGSKLHGRVIAPVRLSTVLGKVGGVDVNYFDPETRAEAPPLPEDPEIDISALVREIVGEATDTQIRARLEGIVEHIHQKLPLKLRGHLVRSAQEAAILGQLIRDPQVEHVWIVYRREGRIVKIEPMSLNRKGEADAGDFEHIKGEAGRLHADAVLRIHNHPSGVAKWSQADKDVAMNWHSALGTLMAEDIIVNSGTFAYRTFENGKYTWHEDVSLNPKSAGWDTTAASKQDDAGELKPDDPLYQNPLIRGTREAANYMWNLKRDMTAAELVFVGTKTGKIVQTITDTQLRSAADPVAHMEQYVQGNQGQHVHVMMWGNDADTVARAIENVDGVDSVWVGSQRITGMDHTRTSSDQTITRDIGGSSQTFVKVTGQVSDPNAPVTAEVLTKPVVIAGVQHDLVRDEERENVALDNRTRGDAEHMTKAVRRLDVDRLDPKALAEAREAIESAVSEVPDTSKKDALQAEYNTAAAYHKALENLMWKMGNMTAREALAYIEATPELQTEEAISIFTSMDPDSNTHGTPHDKVIKLYQQANLRRLDIQSEMRDTKIPAHIDKAVVDRVKGIHTELGMNEVFRRALEQLSYASSVGDALDLIAETSVLQTRNVTNLFEGLDRETRTYDTDIRETIRDMRDKLWERQKKLNEELRDLRDQMDGWGARQVFDMVEEINQSYRMTIDRIESGVGQLSEAAQAKINPALEKLWGHIATEKGVYNIINESGKLLALSPTGDPEVNQGLLAYTSYSAYYRRNEDRYFYGYILDIEKLLEIPGTTGTVHERNVWGGRATLDSPQEIRDAMEAWHDPGGEDIVIEIRTPTDIDINEYLIGVIEDGEVYVKPEYHRDPNIRTRTGGRLQEYQPSAETPFINRATRAMPTKDTLTLQGTGKSRRWLSPQSQLFSKLRLWTPELRKNSRMIANAMRSGYGKLAELKAPYDSDTPAPGDIIEDMLDQRMHISQAWTGRARSVLMPVLKKLNAQVKREEGEDSTARRATVDFDIINFIEHNTPLPERSKNYQSVAEELKETWRKVNQSFVEAMITQIRDLGHREDVTKVGTRGRQKWGPEPMGGMTWKWEAAGGQGRYVDKQGTEYTIAEAFARTDQLWYPHQYDRSRLRDYNRKIEALVKSLNELIAQGDNASEDAFKAAGITKVDGGYRHNRVSTVFPDLDAVVNFYLEIRDRTATLLKYMEDGTIGLYPHLERVRETHDRLYRRDTNLLMSTTALLWDRFAEIATFGQIDPYGELPPRLATLIQTVDHFNANDREAALMAVHDGLQELHRSEESLAEDDRHWGMHESLSAFEGGEGAALRIMQQWEDYIIDDKGNKVKTGKWKGIDINRLDLDEKTLNTLETIGFIESDRQGGWKVRGKTDAAQQTTIAKFFVELMQTKADRRKRIQGLVQSLGHWMQKDPLHEGSDELWRRANTMISIGALGWKQALQNLTEVPAIAMMAGLKSTAGLVKEMQNPEFRAAAEELAQGLKQGVEFLADDNLQEKYLQSAWSMFGWTERTSRMLGVGAGLIRAKSLSKELLASQEGSKNRARIEREMRSLRMNPTVILEMNPREVDTIYSEMIQRIKSQDIALAGVELPSKTPAKHRLTDRIGEEWIRSAMYISDSVFKPYDARTLPAEFQKSTPFARMILKFKGWMFQQNRFMVDQYKRAALEAKRGNFRPLARILQSTLMLTGSVGAAQAVFAMLQGRDENDDELLRAYLHTQTLGLGSVLWEMAVRSEGNLWRLEKTLEGTLVGPVWGTFADVLSPTVTRDWDRSLQEVLQRTPVAREALYLGANRWWEDEE